MYRQKFTKQIKVIDAAAGRVHAIVSTDTKDRDGDIIRQSGWELERFNSHPVLLSSHNYGSLRSQIGKWESMEIVAGNLEGVAQYYVGEGNEEADWGYNLASKGMAAFSVGFIPDMAFAKELKGGNSIFPNYEFLKQELLEVSHVTIPSNSDALQAMKLLKLAPEVQETVEAALLELSPTTATATADVMNQVMPAIRQYIDEQAIPQKFIEWFEELLFDWQGKKSVDPEPDDEDEDEDEDEDNNEEAIKTLADAIRRGTKNGLKEAIHGKF